MSILMPSFTTNMALNCTLRMRTPHAVSTKRTPASWHGGVKQRASMTMAPRLLQVCALPNHPTRASVARTEGETTMGQMALGILYGIEAPELEGSDDYDEPLGDLIYRFHAAMGLPMYPATVDQEYDGDRALLGVWIAIGGSGEPGIPYFVPEAVPLATLPTLYADRLAYA